MRKPKERTDGMKDKTNTQNAGGGKGKPEKGSSRSDKWRKRGGRIYLDCRSQRSTGLDSIPAVYLISPPFS